MGFRWYKGRFLSDWEYTDLLRQESINFWFSIGVIIPTALLGLIGYNFGSGAMWAGIIIGIILGILLNRLMIILGALGIIALILFGIYHSKNNPQKHYYTVSEVNLRASPSKSAEIKTIIQPGQEVFFLIDSVVTGNTTWYKVAYGYEKGWISKKLLLEK